MSRRATRFNKRDQVETSILQALAKLGVTVYEGPPLDLWVWLGCWVPVEEKSGKAPLTVGQKEFVEECAYFDRPCLVWRSAKDAIASVKAWRDR